MPVTAAETFPLDDFSAGNDAGWIHLDQSEEICGKPATYDASSGVYRIAPACDLDAEDDRFTAAQWVGPTDPTLGDGYLRLTARHRTRHTEIWLSLRSFGNERVGLWGYRFGIPAGGSQLWIDRSWEHGSVERLASKTTAELVFHPGHPLNIEAGVVGTRLTLKVWTAGDPEPAQPQLVAFDEVLGPGGDLVIAVGHSGAYGGGPVEGRFDEVVFVAATPDINGDGRVDGADLLAVLVSWGDCGGCPADLTGDGTVGVQDLVILLGNWS